MYQQDLSALTSAILTSANQISAVIEGWRSGFKQFGPLATMLDTVMEDARGKSFDDTHSFLTSVFNLQVNHNYAAAGGVGRLPEQDLPQSLEYYADLMYRRANGLPDPEVIVSEPEHPKHAALISFGGLTAVILIAWLRSP